MDGQQNTAFLGFFNLPSRPLCLGFTAPPQLSVSGGKAPFPHPPIKAWSQKLDRDQTKGQG